MLNFLRPLINKYIDTIFQWNLYWFVALLLCIIIIYPRFVSRKYAITALEKVIYYFFLIGQLILIIAIIVVLAVNFAPKPKLDFSVRISPGTEWVKQDLDIYFVYENALIMTDSHSHKEEIIFESKEPIYSYHISPNGKFIAIVTKAHLFLLDQEKRLVREVDAFDLKNESGKERKGVIDGVSWAPNDDKFCYRISKWSGVSSVEQWIVYNVALSTKNFIQSPTMNMNSLVWDKKGEVLYYLWFVAKDRTIKGIPFYTKIYKITLSDLKPQLIFETAFEQTSLPEEHLLLRDIDIFKPSQRLSFGSDVYQGSVIKSRDGQMIGIDEEDVLFYQNNGWWKIRLYQVPRIEEDLFNGWSGFTRGGLIIQSLNWLPSARYAIMEHYFFGILLLDPVTGKLGVLTNKRGHKVGWYQPQKRGRKGL